MHERTEALAAELEWAASGAAREIDALRQRVDALQRTCDERNAVIADLRAGMEQLREIADERASAITTLDAALTAAQVSLAAAVAERGAEHERVLVLRREYEAELGAARRHGAVLRSRLEQGENDLRLRAVADELQRVCDERLALIEQISGETDALRALAQERAELLAAGDARVATLRRTRDEELSLARREAELLRDQLAQNTHERSAEAVAQELLRVCEERLALIEQLTVEIGALRSVAQERAALLAANEAAFRAREAELIAEGERRTALLADLTAAFEDKVREIEALRGGIPRSA